MTKKHLEVKDLLQATNHRTELNHLVALLRDQEDLSHTLKRIKLSIITGQLLQLLTIHKIHSFKTFSSRHFGRLEKVVAVSLEGMPLGHYQSHH